MNSLGLMGLTFGLLAVSVCAVWVHPLHITKQLNLQPWIIFFSASIVSGLVAGYLTCTAVAELGVFGIAAYMAGHSEENRLRQLLFSLLTAILALALAMHQLPGFNNPVLIANIKFSADAAPFTQYTNFDKSAVGLIILALLCNRARSASDWREIIRRTFPIAVVTTVFVIVTAVSLRYVRPDIKLSWFTPIFLITNLLFTCVAEEAFFRGFLQDRLAKFIPSSRIGKLIVVVCSGALFGAVHFAGGPIYVLLATLGGLGYAYAYATTKRIEAPIIAHFTLNAVHFIFLTYPRIQ